MDLLKLDIARAFDSISSPFLIDVVRHLVFGTGWIEWVSILLSTSSTRVLINGLPGPPIDHAYGQRQGDPVSPMLFMMAIDALNSLLQHAHRCGILQRLTTRHASSSIYLYADDVVIFCHPST
ncbi:Protein MON2-like protein [Hordeum vulgare]|nr:Protein MON2-like protein [Hordeum vulgare]